MEAELSGAVEILRDRLYYVSLRTVPRNTAYALFFTVDNDLVYEPFFADFGPLNLGQLYRFCQILDRKINDPANAKKKIYFYSSHDAHKRANAAYLVSAYAVMCLGRTGEEAYRPFLGIYPPFIPFRDASFGICTYNVTVQDCLMGLHKALENKFIDFSTFNVEEYEYYEKVENGDLNWIVPGKFVAFSGPSNTRQETGDGFRTLIPEDYFAYFRKMNVTTIIRLNKKCYDRKRFVDAGFKHYDLYFVDGGTPSEAILKRFLEICETEPGAVAVHCKAGLGRTGTLIAAYIMKHFHFTASETIAYIRVCRPGSIIGPQQYYLKELEPRLWKMGEMQRKKLTPTQQPGAREAYDAPSVSTNPSLYPSPNKSTRPSSRPGSASAEGQAMTVSALFLMDIKGKVIMSRNYRGDVPMGVVDKFAQRLQDDEADITPVFHMEGVTFVYVKYNNLVLLAVTKRNSNAANILLFLYKLIQVFCDYFKELEEESIRDNFVIIYELLDEMMDFGYPQTTETKILQEYITQESYKLDKDKVRPPMAVTNAVSWRSEGIKYRKNEIFLDVIESVNLLVASNGNVLRSEIVGQLKMRSYLSGMPELKLGLNDKLLFEATGRPQSKGKAVELEDVKFHQCVRLARFENDRTISFIPPDGEFELMSYRLSTQVKPLIWIEAVMESHSRSRVEYMVKAKSQFKQRSTANNVEIFIPVPPDADTPSFKTSIGTVRYAPELDRIVWTIKQFPGGKEFLMRAHFGLPSIQDEEGAKEKPPITVKFEIPYFTVSGIQVRYLKIIEKSGYQALPWVRYITQNGDYQLRMA
eukprot:tig00021181_g19309.t1